MIFKVGKFRFGASFENTHKSTQLFKGKQLRVFFTWETSKLRKFREKIMEAKNGRKTDEKRRVG